LNTVAQTKPALNYPSLARVQRPKNPLQLALQHCEANRIGWNNGFGVFNQVTKLAVTVFTKWCG
jgi:hypothetical protein